MLGMALHLRDQELSLREIAARLVITKGDTRRRRGGRYACPPAGGPCARRITPDELEIVPERGKGPA